MNKKYQYGIIGGIVFVCLVVGMYFNKHNGVEKFEYIEFMMAMENHQVEKVMLSESDMFTFYKKEDSQKYQAPNPRKETFKEELLLKGIEVRESQGSTLGMIQYVFSAMIFFGVFFVVFKKAGKGLGGKGMMSLEIKPIEPESLKEDFSHIAGNVEAKEQVADLIAFIKNPEKYAAVGARMPKGVIFYGPPGTGKTLMAKAIAKEAHVPFFSVSGADFVQLYVGVGASRVREIFSEARKHHKAVIFIDEIDAIGKKRSQSANGGNEEKDQTLNALLTEMSGFKEDSGIVVVAATNRVALLDDALLRPGRFDRQIEIGYPDLAARKQIIRLHLKGKPVSERVSVDEIAKQTVYFTGAMLENLLNEAAILAANAEATMIEEAFIDQAFYRVIAGMEKKDRSGISQREREITAYHEAGHALITKLLSPESHVTKVTIVPSTKGAGGFSMNVPKDKMYMTKQELLTQIKISLAGRGAEEIIFGQDQVTTGASNDIEKATSYLKDYMIKYGMDDQIGLINLEVLLGSEKLEDEAFVGRCEKHMAALYEETKKLIIAHEEMLQKLAQKLLEQESLNEQEIDDLMLL